MACHVHDPAGYLSVVSNAEFVEPLRRSCSPRSFRELQEERQREAIRLRLHAQDTEFAAQLASAKQSAEQRRQAKREAEDRDFEERFAKFLADQTGFVRDLRQEVKELDDQQQRRKEALHEGWAQSVYRPIQSEILARVEASPAHAMGASRGRSRGDGAAPAAASLGASGSQATLDRSMQERLDRMAGSIKYSVKVQDPLFSSLGTHFDEEFSALAGVLLKRKGPEYRNLASPLEYLRPEATPNGRYSEQNTRLHQRRRVANAPRDKLALPDHYAEPSLEDTRVALRSEVGGGKRMVSHSPTAPGPRPTGRKALQGPPDGLGSL